MELAVKVLFGVLCYAGLCFMMGFISAWWEQRQRDKKRGVSQGEPGNEADESS